MPRDLLGEVVSETIHSVFRGENFDLKRSYLLYVFGKMTVVKEVVRGDVLAGLVLRERGG
jgi:hypothetical protein